MSDRVLVVEDNLALAENIAELLSDEPIETVLCADAGTALHAAERGFDLVILDIGLGGAESGLDLIPRLRAHSAHGEILLMTGDASLQSAMLAIRRGVYAYLPKPFEPTELVTLVKRALAQVALKREKHSLAQRLSASEALHRSLVEAVETCILGLDAGGIVRFANRSCAERLGHSVVQLVGSAFIELAEGRSRGELARAVARAEAGHAVRDLECRHVTPGGVRTLRWTLTPLTPVGTYAAPSQADDAESNPVVLAVGADITDRLELEHKRAEAEAIAAMGTLTTSLAHEIRNPLNAAKLQLELLLRRAARAREGFDLAHVTEPAELVRAELTRLSCLLDDFLNLARPRPALRAPCSVSELLEDAARLEQPVAQAAQVTLRVAACPPELQIRADADKLKQVLINLIGNAIEALSEAPGTREVALSAAPGPRGVWISVSDNGPGVAPELADAAFKPFVTNKPGGTGLGLAIVQKIVAQHGGDAELSARDGGGTVARFLIPA